MKKLLLLAALAVSAFQSYAQITITAADMPVSGDTLRYSTAVATTLNTTATGANTAWDFSLVTPLIQAVDTYKTASQVSPLYGFTISSTAYGYKLGDSIPGLSSVLPVTISAVYNFFEKVSSPSSYVNAAFAANLSGFPAAFNYSDNDDIYFFPLAYGNVDSSTFYLPLSVATIGSLTRRGTRVTTVDGWGTIVTPYYTTPVSCIRVRSVISETDTFTYQGTSIPIPALQTVEYKWLVNGAHYPAMYITSNVVNGSETNTAAQYRDSARSTPLAIASVAPAIQTLTAYPDPATGKVNLRLPAGWQQYTVMVYDMQGRAVLQVQNTAQLDLTGIAAGSYLVNVLSGNQRGLTRIIKN